MHNITRFFASRLFWEWVAIWNLITMVTSCVRIAREGYATTLADVTIIAAMLAVYGFHRLRQLSTKE